MQEVTYTLNKVVVIMNMLYNVRQHDHFIILGNTRLRVSTILSHPQGTICELHFKRQFYLFNPIAALHNFQTNVLTRCIPRM